MKINFRKINDDMESDIQKIESGELTLKQALRFYIKLKNKAIRERKEAKEKSKPVSEVELAIRKGVIVLIDIFVTELKYHISRKAGEICEMPFLEGFTPFYRKSEALAEKG